MIKSRFKVALSFPGQHRDRIESIAGYLAQSLGRDHILYDKWYDAEFARRDLDIYLADLYHSHSELLVVFLCAEYENSEWCNLEWHDIRDLLKQKQADRVMFLTFDPHAKVAGIRSNDGYLDIRTMANQEVADKILKRYSLLGSPPEKYLAWLREQTSTIDIRGFIGSSQVHLFPIEELYIPLTTTAPQQKDPQNLHARAAMDLRDALEHRRLVVVGDPGSGKSTFLRRITHQITGDAQQGADKIPVFIRVAELTNHMERHPNQEAPESPQWLLHFLHAKNNEYKWGLQPDFFSKQLQSGSAVVLLDGLDEAPDQEDRERIARLVEKAANTYPQCQFVVTTRPKAYHGMSLLRNFHEASIEPLETQAIETFLDHWCKSLYQESEVLARDHRRELGEALRLVPEIRRMARNPVMLTALAVVHYNQTHLPEQRAALYDAILTWLARARKDMPGREKPDRCLELLSELALQMQDGDDGKRQVRIATVDGAEKLAHEFVLSPQQHRKRDAQRFLERETGDSGIIVSRGGDIQFWHLTFQEYLAAVAIASRSEADQIKILLDPKSQNLYQSEWREVALLFSGVLGVKQGKAKVDGFVSQMIAKAGTELKQQARTIGLIGAMEADLRPIGYAVRNEEYARMQERVMALFEKGKTRDWDLQTRIEAAQALDQASPARRLRTPNDPDYWVTIPGGILTTGDDAKAYDPLPKGTHPIQTFEIGKFPVTVWEYSKYLDATGVKPPARWDDQVLHWSRPVTEVTYEDATNYCEWANCKLPSEFQWEHSARCTRNQHRIYPWGDALPDQHLANFDNPGGAPTPVGMFPDGDTPEGVSDMAGNVWEWTSSDYGKEEAKVVRGASYYDVATYLRAALRNWYEPGNSNFFLGFRCLRE